MSYAGGKEGAGVYQSLICMMPPHRVYIEAFLGGGAVIRHKRPALVNIGIDKDAHAVEGVKIQLASSELTRGSFFRFITADALEFLREYPFRGEELIYLDPPYLLSTRRQHRRIYRYEMTSEEEHAEILRLIVTLPCMVMLSGYQSVLYDTALARWRREEFYTGDRGGNRRLECVWLNFPPPLELHDYRFLGKGFRERERIKRKRERWKAKLLRMPELERHAILSAVSELRAGTARQV